MKRILFVGNRRFVLEAILANKLPVAGIGVVAGTHLEHDMQSSFDAQTRSLCTLLHTKQEVIDFCRHNDFDVFVSNGCPFILPISDLPKATYVNIHPSLLPDLKGYDPVIGAILFGRDAGATCHIMDDGVDTGDIIAQVKIPNTPDLDVVTLYQLSFRAEREVFALANARDFKPCCPQQSSAKDLIYRRRPEDMHIAFNEPNDVILRKIKAFNNRKIGCSFDCNQSRFRVFHAEIMTNPYLEKVVKEVPEGTIALSYENSIVFHKDGDVIRFSHIVADQGGVLAPMMQLFAPEH
ncbi:MAG: hypothetical protein IJS54_07720 [Desulfovibrio sp.]|nr:hypothetical protein [Desulfovibrio sp.]